MSASCIYEGEIRHRRFDPRREFSHRLALAYLDLDELPGLLDADCPNRTQPATGTTLAIPARK